MVEEDKLKNIKSWFFREKIAQDIIRFLPQIAEDYLAGKTSREIKLKYDIPNFFNVEDYENRIIETSILMALGGYNSLIKKRWIDGLMPREKYKTIAEVNRRSNGSDLFAKIANSRKANEIKFLKMGKKPLSDEERFLIYLGMYSPHLKDKRGRVRRKELTRIINNEIHDGKPIRTVTFVRNVMSNYTRLAKKNPQINRKSFYLY